MARMLRANVTQWQRWRGTPHRGGWTYAYDVKGSARAREEAAWRSDWEDDVWEADVLRYEVEALRRMLPAGFDVDAFLA